MPKRLGTGSFVPQASLDASIIKALTVGLDKGYSFTEADIHEIGGSFLDQESIPVILHVLVTFGIAHLVDVLDPQGRHLYYKVRKREY